MLDKVIHKHLDIMQEIEDSAREEIEQIVGNIDIDLAMEAPDAAMGAIAIAIEDMLLEKYFEKIIKEGKRFAKEVGETKKIVVPDTKDPKLNEDLADAKRNN